MKWDVMDVREMTYKDNSFDLIIDKSTLDALTCSLEGSLEVAYMLKECQRVLKPGGTYISISFADKKARQHHFQRDHLGFSF